MYARTTTLRFQPGTADEATRIIQEIMLPGASTQRGFRGAFMLKSDTDTEKYTIISLWETLDDLLESSPPEEIVPLLEPLDDFITETSQDTCDVLFHIDEHSPTHKKPNHK